MCAKKIKDNRLKWKFRQIASALLMIICIYHSKIQFAVYHNVRDNEKVINDFSSRMLSKTRIKIAHVIPINRKKNCNEPFCPFDQGQDITLAK